MLQHDSFTSRPRSVQTMFVWVAVALLMSVGSVQAASIGVSDNQTDQTTSGLWEFIWGSVAVGCVLANGDIWIAPPSKGSELSSATGVTPIQDSVRNLVELATTSTQEIRFLNGTPCSMTVEELAEMGFDTVGDAPVPNGFTDAVQYTAD